MSDPTKVIVYVAPQGTWLPFVDEDGVHDALDLSNPMRLVAERDYAKLALSYVRSRAERDALRTEIERKDAALAQYANSINWMTHTDQDDDNVRRVWLGTGDGRTYARLALAALAVQPITGDTK
jgi:hypothetical protein